LATNLNPEPVAAYLIKLSWTRYALNLQNGRYGQVPDLMITPKPAVLMWDYF